MYEVADRLGDGREILYFDRAAPRQPAPDQRHLPAPDPTSESRYDLATGDWIIVASHRQTRTFQPEADDCPLCPSRGGRLTEVPASDYEVVVFENRFPALAGGGKAVAGGDPTGVLASTSGAGRCEVICFSSEHDMTFAGLDLDRVRLVLDVWAERTRALGALPDVTQVFCFENRGPEMGVSQLHPHGQIYAYPYLTPRTARMLSQTQSYRREHDRNMFDDILAAELADGRRVVRATAEWVAFVPYAARWPYEVHLYPRRRRADLTRLDEAQRDGFAAVYLDLLRRFDRLFDPPTPYVAAWHQAPNVPVVDDFAVHLELFTNRRSSVRLKVLGGTEVAMDAFSNDVGAERAAEHLRGLAD